MSEGLKPNVPQISSITETIPDGFNSTLRKIFWDKFHADTGREVTANENQFSADLSTQNLHIPRSLEDEVGMIRNSIFSNDLRLRGTSREYMTHAKESGSISSKKVSDWWESDIGEVAAYRIPTTYSNLSNSEFLYRLSVTAISSLNYGIRHGVLASALFARSKTDDPSTFIQERISLLSRIPEEALPALVLFSARGKAARQGEKDYAKEFYKNRPQSIQSGGNYLGNLNHSELKFFGKSLLPFPESAHTETKASFDEATHFEITRSEIEKVLSNILSPDSHEYDLFQKLIHEQEKSGIERKDAITAAFKALVMYLLGERAVQLILKKMRDMATESNE